MIGGKLQRKADARFENVSFDSYKDLVKYTRENFRGKVTLWYNGWDLCGDVEIEFSCGVDSEFKNKYLNFVGITLKYC